MTARSTASSRTPRSPGPSRQPRGAGSIDGAVSNGAVSMRDPGPGIPAAPVPAAARDLLAASARGLAEAALATTPAQRYALAHLAALRAAAAILATRARPARSRSRLHSVWVLLPAVAPDLEEWAAFFAAGAGKRAAAEAGLPGSVTAREADDLQREAETFLGLVVRRLGLPHAAPLPSSVRLRPTA